MSKKKTLFLGFLILSVSTVSAIEVSTGSSCDDLEPLISLNDTEGGHVAEPGFDYPHKICIEETETDLKEKCSKDEEILFTMDRRNNSHLSIFENTYNHEMCSKDLDADVVSDTSCVNGTKAASLAKKDNTHAAYPSYNQTPYNQSLCLTTKEPENVTLSLEGVSSTNFYADGAEINQGDNLRPPVENPYISSDQPIGIVSYGRFMKLSRPKTDKISLTQSEGSFLVPLTEKGYLEIEEEMKQINKRLFLDTPLPNFYKPTTEDKYRTKIIYDAENQIETERTGLREKGKIKLANKGLDENLEVKIKIE